jgi:hypothetical protein
MAETSREKCRVVVSRRIQKRCARFKPRNNRRKRTRQVPKASGPSILEDRWQRSGSFREFGVREFGGQTKFLVSRSPELRGAGKEIQTIGSKPRENRWIRTSAWYRVSGVRGLKEFLFDCRSREVPSAEGSCEHVAHPLGGDRVVDRWRNNKRPEKGGSR